jgi:hypothetical protein
MSVYGKKITIRMVKIFAYRFLLFLLAMESTFFRKHECCHIKYYYIRALSFFHF